MKMQQARRAVRRALPDVPVRRAVPGAPALAALAVAVLAAACATPTVGPGEARDSVISRWGPPTARYAMSGGGERLEYATGPYGRMTWMIDIDAGGRAIGATQVLNEAHFADFQGRAPGMSRAALLRELGRPGEVTSAGLIGGELWSWRYPTNDCLWFQVTLDTAADRVRAAGYNIDWACDARTLERN
ncbi:MAG: hypothetical protein HZC37_22210 [Burkholderiales bacterium]|nr:hypothetical protein [Burkholderiales bacterium]